MSAPTGSFPTVESLIPHRPPFLLVDRLVALEPGQSAVGEWLLDPDASWFAGHFPGRPTLPGVLMVESLAQTGACAVLADARFSAKLPLFGGVDGVRFRRQAVPGDTLHLSVELERMSARGGRGVGRATVDGELACEARMLFVLVDP